MAAKGLYAIPIGWLAGASPADLTIQSVVESLSDDDLASEPRICRVRELDGGAALIETPRYQEFTEILIRLAQRRKRVLEIAGNRRILTTVIAREDAHLTEGVELFSIPIQSDPGMRRVGVDVDVPQLSAFIRAVESQGAQFEHAYDY
jgi:hypothetical protein